MTWPTAMSTLIVYKMFLTLYDMAYYMHCTTCPCCVHCVLTRHVTAVSIVQDITNIVRHGLLHVDCVSMLCPC